MRCSPLFCNILPSICAKRLFSITRRKPEIRTVHNRKCVWNRNSTPLSHAKFVRQSFHLLFFHRKEIKSSAWVRLLYERSHFHLRKSETRNWGQFSRGGNFCVKKVFEPRKSRTKSIIYAAMLFSQESCNVWTTNKNRTWTSHTFTLHSRRFDLVSSQLLASWAAHWMSELISNTFGDENFD